MTVKVNWDNADKTVIRYEFNGSWTGHEFDIAVELSFKMTESVAHEVHAIMDMRRSKQMPDNAMLLFKRKFSVLPYNRGLIAVVGADKTALTVFRMILRMNHRLTKRIIMTENLVEARSRLRKTDMAQVLQPENAVFAI